MLKGDIRSQWNSLTYFREILCSTLLLVNPVGLELGILCKLKFVLSCPPTHPPTHSPRFCSAGSPLTRPLPKISLPHYLLAHLGRSLSRTFTGCPWGRWRLMWPLQRRCWQCAVVAAAAEALPLLLLPPSSFWASFLVLSVGQCGAGRTRGTTARALPTHPPTHPRNATTTTTTTQELTNSPTRPYVRTHVRTHSKDCVGSGSAASARRLASEVALLGCLISRQQRRC